MRVLDEQRAQLDEEEVGDLVTLVDLIHDDVRHVSYLRFLAPHQRAQENAIRTRGADGARRQLALETDLIADARRKKVAKPKIKHRFER